MMLIDNNTRWNSWFYILRVALIVKDSINKTIKQHYDELKDNYLLSAD